MKIFCIGYNKTGTCSLHHIFKLAGIKSLHKEEWAKMSHNPNPKKYFDETADAYSDGEEPDFVKLDKLYPNAQFILNTRPLRDWLISRIKHVNRYYPLTSGPKLGNMAKEYFKSPRKTIQKWITKREKYYAKVLQYFKGKPTTKLLIIDVTKQGYHKIISEHFGIEALPWHRNHRDMEECDKRRIEREIQLIDSVLKEMNKK